MTMPSARKITVNEVEYHWLVKSRLNDRNGLGWTPPVLSIFIQKEPGTKIAKTTIYLAKSNKWTSEHEAEFFDGPGLHNVSEHKVTFTPAHVRNIIEHDFRVSPILHTEEWDIEIAGD